MDDDEAIAKQEAALGVNVRERPELLEARPEWIVDALDEVRRGTRRRSATYLLAARRARPSDLAARCWRAGRVAS